MQDAFGRKIEYLRLSVTDLCNYRCVYCMSAAGVCKKARSEILSLEELAEIGAAAVRCGVKKIRLTGGEPLLRPGIVSLCRMLRAVEGLEELTLTTNGSLLPAMAKELRSAGVDRLNVSVDSLDSTRFRSITRRGTLADVQRGLAAAREAGFENTKLNVVLLGGINDDEIRDFAALTKDTDYCVRFIELMPMEVCAAWPRERFLSAQAVFAAVPELAYLGSDGVAEQYRLPGNRGTVGLIRAMSGCFCARCNRIRVTADGKLKPCLHSAAEFPLRGKHGAALEQAIREAAARKPAGHRLTQCECSETPRAMNEIGG